MRKSFIVVFLIISILILYFNRSWIIPNTYVSGWGASSAKSDNQSTTQTIKFNATIKNDGHYPVYVKEIKTLFLDSIKNNFNRGIKRFQLING